MPIQVPHVGSHVTFHVALSTVAPDLLNVLKGPLLDLANAAEPPWTRLDRVLEAADAAWEAHLGAGGSPRAVGNTWIGAVADLAQALVEEAVRALPSLPDDERGDVRRALAALVDRRFSGAPNYMMMSLPLMSA